MITGERILEVSGKRLANEPIRGLNINIMLEAVTVKGEDIEMTYEYTATYEQNVGELKIKGVLTAKEDKKLAKEIEDEWKKSKKIPDSYAELILGAIQYSGSANGTLIARVCNLTAPLIPPKIQLGRKQ